MVYSADLVLSRAGAGTISEVSAAGIPMVLVPGPFAGGHQRLNVEPYQAAGAAVTIPDAATAPKSVGTPSTSPGGSRRNAPSNHT